MRLFVRGLPALAFTLVAATPASPPAAPRGFYADGAAAEIESERQMRAIPDPAVARETMRHLSESPHHLGSAQGGRNAEWILAKFKEFGLDARIETFEVLFPTPRERILELVEPSKFRAALAETPVSGDPTSSQTAEQLPSFNAFSIDGEATAPLVYVNYGMPADYEVLERLGVDVRGAIVDRPVRRRLARHQAEGRRRARRDRLHHLLATRETTDTSRARRTRAGHSGPSRASSAAASPTCRSIPGDPLTPGVGATHDAPRLEREDAKTLTKIPVLPISYAGREASPFGPRRARRAEGVARRPAAHLPHRPRAGARAPEARLRLEARPGARRRREARRIGLARRVGDPRQPPRRLGQRRRRSDQRSRRRCSRRRAPSANAREEGLAAQADDRLLRLGRRGARAASARPSGWRRTRRSSPRRPSRTSTPTARAADSSTRAASHVARAARLGSGGGRRGPREEDDGARPRLA